MYFIVECPAGLSVIFRKSPDSSWKWSAKTFAVAAKHQ